MKKYIKSNFSFLYRDNDWKAYKNSNGDITIERNCMHYLDGLPDKVWTTVYVIEPSRLISYSPFGNKGTVSEHFNPELTPKELEEKALALISKQRN